MAHVSRQSDVKNDEHDANENQNVISFSIYILAKVEDNRTRIGRSEVLVKKAFLHEKGIIHY